MAFYSTTAIFNSVDKVSDIVGRIGDNIAAMGDRVQRDMMQAVNQTKGLEHAFGTLAVAGVGVATAAIAQGVQQFFDLNSEMAGLSVRTGMTGADLETFKKQVTEAFANQGIITNISDMARVVEAIKTQTQGLAATELTKFTGEVAAVAKAFGLDPSNLADQVGKVQAKFNDLKTASPEKTLDLLLKLAQDTGEPLGEMADNAAKIGSKLAGAGLSGIAAIGLLDLAAQGGVTKFTDLTTAVQTFHDKLAKPSWAVQQALRDLGLNTLVKDVQTNKVTYEAALDMVFTKLSKMEDPAKRAKDATALFGTSVAKLGGPEVLEGLAGFTTKMDDAKGAAERATKSMGDNFGAFISQNWNAFTTGISTGVDTVYLALKNANWDGAIKTVTDAAIGFLQGLITKIGEVLGLIESSAPTVNEAYGMAQGKTEHPKAGIPGLPLQGPIEAHAVGGQLGEGMNIVGEQGPEAIWKQGGRAQVFTARETKQILGSGVSGGGHSTVVHLSIGYLVGSGGLQELARILVPYQQRETSRRETG